MSAFMVNAEHLNVMVWAAMSRPAPKYPGDARALAWPSDDPAEPTPANGLVRSYSGPVLRWVRSTGEAAQAVYLMLEEANAASVRARHGEDGRDAGRPRGVYRRPRHTGWSTGELLKAVSCYEYQACETADWRQSEAHAFCQALRAALAAEVPGYDEGDTWDINPDSEPLGSR
jgi:hypothetical protein